MKSYQYVRDFENLGFGLFIHYGLYSIIGKGEWSFDTLNEVQKKEYAKLTEKFFVKKDWAKKIVATAKKSGCRYAVLTTRHHDGFSLYDTMGLSEFQAPSSACQRDLVKEFVDECNKQKIKPFFYHTLLDWHNGDYANDFDSYMEYLIKSVEILCINYGEIGGLWFDGFWDKPSANWQFDRLYKTIRKHQPNAMIINNTGLNALGQVSHPEIDSVTFERGKPTFVDNSDRPRAGEMCEGITDHWGYTKDDICYKSTKQLLDTLITCRKCNCNFLINAGPLENGTISPIEKQLLENIGKWIKINKNFIYKARSSEITAENATILKDDRYYYAIIPNVPMGSFHEPNVLDSVITLNTNKKIKNAIWLDSKEKINLESKNSFRPVSFRYGTSLYMRVARFTL